MTADVEIAEITDPKRRALAIGARIDEHQAAIAELSRLRRETLEELIAGGMTQTQVADLLGMSKGRVSQLMSVGLRPERAFLGTGKLTVAIGAKRESNRSDPSNVLSAEAFNAYERLGAAARAAGLDAVNEVVPAPGNVHLNRPNLVVLTNPRLLPFLGQVMEADPHIRYVLDDKGWHLVDLTTGTEYRSPRDHGEPADYGYVGRLPRPDRKGTFLYLAGTHAPGTLGAAAYVADNLAELYRELKTRRFSTIVKCVFEPGNQLNIISTDRVTPLYRHEGA
ncbi:sigma factor-like helix-turn-helix DNA-binding protein [Micromonospora sp. WMMD987]|uniref:sigma factor-like helix-turn-helix DNA-binding protein n=1 Tax=Micromonospora sp. WMMD987 TaxID=3016089 RepID=UPI00249C003C|nr:sigma factor-like helix-turn-helix DNA-binding protein [Micromonospora sp. WMMD987]WFE94511.1 sigma factor-like helix-turn-helix DNA-binding protein [Micromonospora sp. WMMD987]